MRIFRATLKILGVVTGTVSLISVVQRFFDVGIASEFAKLVEYYADIVGVVFRPLQYITPFEIPPILFDIWALSLIGSAAYIRAIVVKGKLNGEDREIFESPLGFGIAVLFCGLSGFGILLILFTYSLTMDSLVSSRKRREMQESPQDWIMLNEIRTNFHYVIAGCMVFYALNSIVYECY